ncbi:flavodoxin domain-containing protein [Fundicoccus culcitae]|uniref:Flavodoxin domain-containing protein n=1 Tax=Fundicoccus culcitae TaxID=2969821 RepID=A0ABY5P4G7_9LACT|nr:flavodoxin domain-containing protein [Fundicoccus culcitae]UUX33582.1 flavodoxin domain-containing protein [Fundicoccus culcitae]
MKPIVVYQSKMGSSKQYAEWIAEAISCPVIERSQLKEVDWQSSDLIIYVAGIYVGKILGFKELLKQLGDLSQKRLVLCMVGMTDLKRKDEFQKFFEQNVPEDLQKKVRSFNLRGNIIYSKLGFLDRTLLQMPKMQFKNKTLEEAGLDNYFIEHFGEDVYYIEKNAINKVVDYYNDLEMRAKGI